MKISIQLHSFVLVLLLATGCATSKKQKGVVQVQDVVEELKLLKDVTPWLDYKFTEHPFLFVSKKRRTAHRLQEGQLTLLDYYDWKKTLGWSESPFDFVEHQNQKYLVINLDAKESVESTLRTALHEGFHWFYQDEVRGWKTDSKLSAARGDFYPLLSRPRYFRWVMMDELFNYLESGQELHLRAFSWWFLEWEEQFPEEAKNNVDRVEGSTQYYTTNMMVTLSNKKSGKNKAIYKDPFLARNFDKRSFSVDSESYVIGTLAGLALDKLKIESWQKQVNKGESALQILASSIEPKVQKLNPALQKEFLDLSVEKMNELDRNGQLDQTIAGFANRKVIKVALSLKSYKGGAFSVKAMYRPFFKFANVDGITMVQLHNAHKKTFENSKIQFEAGDVYVMANKNPCGKPAAILLLSPKRTTFENGRIKNQGDHLIDLPAKKSNVENWYCSGF